jgi:hypothetical protein
LDGVSQVIGGVGAKRDRDEVARVLHGDRAGEQGTVRTHGIDPGCPADRVHLDSGDVDIPSGERGGHLDERGYTRTRPDEQTIASPSKNPMSAQLWCGEGRRDLDTTIVQPDKHRLGDVKRGAQERLYISRPTRLNHGEANIARGREVRGTGGEQDVRATQVKCNGEIRDAAVEHGHDAAARDSDPVGGREPARHAWDGQDRLWSLTQACARGPRIAPGDDHRLACGRQLQQRGSSNVGKVGGGKELVRHDPRDSDITSSVTGFVRNARA